MAAHKTSASRRTVLMAAFGLTAVPVLAAAGAAQAAGTLPKANAKYQDTPKGAQQCSNCNYFVPGATGACKVVAGDISPKGWCVLYAPKH